jgi:hypothetical protein
VCVRVRVLCVLCEEGREGVSEGGSASQHACVMDEEEDRSTRASMHVHADATHPPHSPPPTLFVNMPARAHKHTKAHTQTHTPTNTHTHTHSQRAQYNRAPAQARTHARTHTARQARAGTHECMHAHTHVRTHTPSSFASTWCTSLLRGTGCEPTNLQ